MIKHLSIFWAKLMWQQDSLKSCCSVLRQGVTILGLCFCLLPINISLASKSPQTSSELILVTHPSTPDRTLKFQTLRAIYSMRMQTWPDGDPIRVFVLPDTYQAHKDFCKTLLKTLPRHLRRNWDRLVFSGIAQAPSAVNSTTEMKQKIANTPGAIGYIPREEIDDTVVIVHIDS